jgi:tetratricopeptide (TPR) repeat protein
MKYAIGLFVASALSVCAALAQTTPPANAAPGAASPAAPTPAPVKRYNVYKENAKAQAALTARDYKTAIKIFTEVLGSNKLADNWVAPTYFMRGKAFRLSRQNDKALSDYDSALKKDPKFDIAWYEQALIYRQQDKFGLAIESQSKAIEVKPGNATYFYARCESRLFLNKLKEAEADCKKALELKRDYISALSTLGRVYEDSKQKSKAIETYRQVLAVEPGNRMAKDGLDFLNGN